MNAHDLRRHCWPLLALALAAWIAGCGKHHAGQGTAAQLRQIRLMTAADSGNHTCYVVAEVANAGQQPVRKAQVTATLMSAGGKPRGVNYCFLTDLQPGEHRVFSMTVGAQGTFRDVQLSFQDPQKK